MAGKDKAMFTFVSDTASSRSSGPGGSKQSGKSSDTSKRIKSCRVQSCDKEVKGNSKFCGKHRRAHDAMKESSLVGATADQPTEASQAFVTIFGDKQNQGDQDLESQVFGDFLAKNQITKRRACKNLTRNAKQAMV